MRPDPRLTALFEPKSVAVVGASANPGKIGHIVLANLVRAGYRGKLYPVNPRGGKILGLPVAARLAEIPDPVDLAVVCLPRELVLAAAREIAAAAIPAAVVISAGFKEVGHDGYLLERELARIARGAGIALLGPNSLGLFNAGIGLNASFAPEAPPAGSIAFFSQSGALCAAILDWAAAENVGFSKFVSLGNEAVLDERHMLKALADDPRTSVILGYCESVEDGRDFRRIAEAVTEQKPVIMIKAGSTAAGARAASSHTGALSGSPQACRAAFRQGGIIEVLEVKDLFTLARAFACQPLPAGPNLAVVTNSGGPGILAADACEKSRLTLARPSQATIERLKGFLPPFASLYNPIDIIGDADAVRFAKATQAVVEDPLVHAVLVLLTPTASAEPENTARAVVEAARSAAKPVFGCFMGQERVGPGRDILLAAGVPCYAFPEPAVAAIEAMYGYRLWRERPKSPEACVLRDLDRARAILDKAKRQGLNELVEFKAQGLASAYGLPVPATVLARTSLEAVRAAETIGFPVALKVASPSVAHKSALGGVALGLASAEAVRKAFVAVTSRFMRLRKDDHLAGCLVQAMAPKDSREVVLGLRRDPQFGPLLFFGLAGVHTQVLHDFSRRLAPLTQADAREMLHEVKALPLLRGFRGEPAVDLHAVAEILLALSQMAVDFPQILEADLDPVLVNPQGALVADVRLTIE
jgi:acetyltransferase